MQNYITEQNGRIWLMIITFPIVIGISWLFYILRERPSKNISKRMKYNLYFIKIKEKKT